MSTDEAEKSRVIKVVAFTDYDPGLIVSRAILKKITGYINVMSFDSTEKAQETFSPFDSFIQIIEGNTDILINKESHILHEGEAIIIPGNTVYIMKAKKRFKMILTIIKSGYE